MAHRGPRTYVLVPPVPRTVSNEPTTPVPTRNSPRETEGPKHGVWGVVGTGSPIFTKDEPHSDHSHNGTGEDPWKLVTTNEVKLTRLTGQ